MKGERLMKKFGTKIGAIAMSAAMALSFAPGSVITSLAAKGEHEDLIATLQQAVPVYSLYNPNSGEHVFTILEDERDNLVTNGWENEGVKWYAPTTGMDVYRLYKPNAADNAGNPVGDHRYTTSTSERDELLAAGWQEGDAVFKSVVIPGPYSSEVYCVYNPNAYAIGMSGAHHFTINADEVKGLLELGWQEEDPKFDGYYLDIDEIEEADFDIYLNNDSPRVGNFLEVTVEPGETDVTFQWYLDGIEIPNTDQNFLIVNSDMLGSVIYVSATDAHGHTVFSEMTDPVAEETLSVSIDKGSPVVGDILNAITNPEDAVVTYQWFLQGDELPETDQDFLFVTEDMIGKVIQVSATDETGQTVFSWNTEQVTGSGEDVPGGLVMNKQDAVALPEDVATAFTEAAGTTGLVPVAYVAEQIVSGTNYMILCRDEKEFRMIVISRDLQGGATLENDAPFVLSDYVFESSEAQDEVLAGGWHTPAQLTKLPLPEDAEAAFEKALDGFVGSTVEPMALLGTQVVSGTNYAILCSVTPVTSNSIPSVEVVTVYEYLDGNAQFANFRTVNPSDFS